MQDFLNKNNLSYNDLNLFEQAIIHRSYINENPNNNLGHNERLEFLGDSVLELIVTDYLFKKFPDLPEGDLTSYRSALVNTNTLGDIANGIGLNELLKLSKGESKDTKSRARQSILADAYEALVGAIYIDKGYSEANLFVGSNLLIHIDDIIRSGQYKDSKSYVQERTQELLQLTPTYKIINESGPDHDKTFVVGIYFNEKLISEGVGKSKQLAEVDAAKNAVIKNGWN